MTMLRCAVLDDYQNVALGSADWSPLAGRVEVRTVDRPLAGIADLAETVGDCEILVIMRERTGFPAEAFERLPRLRLLVTTGPRNASVDMAAATRHGVTVCGTASASEPPAELTWALILGLARHLPAETAALRRDGPWQQTVGMDLHGRRLGVLGLGRVGAHVAAVGRAFGMDVAAWSQNLTAARAAECGARLAPSLDELLGDSDFVTVHLKLSDRTRGLLGGAELKRMRPTAFLVNTSRAQIVDQEALVEALESGWIAGAAADVFAVEPLPVGDRLRRLPNLLATPHIGYVTARNYATFYGDAVADIEAFLAGAPVRVVAG
jgi:phosphoglycerate dehydrogenase-like enzyme